MTARLLLLAFSSSLNWRGALGSCIDEAGNMQLEPRRALPERWFGGGADDLPNDVAAPYVQIIFCSLALALLCAYVCISAQAAGACKVPCKRSFHRPSATVLLTGRFSCLCRLANACGDGRRYGRQPRRATIVGAITASAPPTRRGT